MMMMMMMMMMIGRIEEEKLPSIGRYWICDTDITRYDIYDVIHDVNNIIIVIC
jgi:hypothetical protein